MEDAFQTDDPSFSPIVRLGDESMFSILRLLARGSVFSCTNIMYLDDFGRVCRKLT